MSDSWFPLSIERARAEGSYQELHEGIPAWLESPLYSWVVENVERQNYYDGAQEFLTTMAVRLHIPFDSVSYQSFARSVRQILGLNPNERLLDLVDYLLAYGTGVDSNRLDEMLRDGGSAWKVGMRGSFLGLQRRINEGVESGLQYQIGPDTRSGEKLSRAWASLYSREPNFSEAYSLAVKAVEDVVLPVVCPKDTLGTLGKALSALREQKCWSLKAGSLESSRRGLDAVICMMEWLWKGQRNRHGGGVNSDKSLLEEETVTAVSLATSLIHLFTSGCVVRGAEE